MKVDFDKKEAQFTAKKGSKVDEEAVKKAVDNTGRGQAKSVKLAARK